MHDTCIFSKFSTEMACVSTAMCAEYYIDIIQALHKCKIVFYAVINKLYVKLF